MVQAPRASWPQRIDALTIRHFKFVDPSLLVTICLEIVSSANQVETRFSLSSLLVTLLSWHASHLNDKTRQARDATKAEIQQLRQDRGRKVAQYQDAVQMLGIAGERLEACEVEIERLQRDRDMAVAQFQRAVRFLHARSRNLIAICIEMNRLRIERNGALAANEAKDEGIVRLKNELLDALEAKARLERDGGEVPRELIRSSKRSIEGHPLRTLTTPTFKSGWLN